MDTAYIDEINNSYRLALFCTANVVDKNVEVDYTPSKYEIMIQTGAANTEERICRLNDHDGFDESISKLNLRYGEFSAWYWVWKNIKTPYIGFCHYRRKWILSDEQIDGLLEDGMDMLSTAPEIISCESVGEHYRRNHYGYDWDVMLSILEEKNPFLYEASKRIYDRNVFHTRCISFFKREVFDDCCNTIFSVAEEFLKRVPNEKKDKSQQRDVAFLLERLVSLYFDVMSLRGGKCYVAKYRLLGENKEKGVLAEASENSIIDKCAELLHNNRWFDAAKNIDELMQTGVDDCRLLAIILDAYKEERRILPATIADYFDRSDDLKSVIKFADLLAECIRDLLSVGAEDYQDMFEDIVIGNGASIYLVRGLMKHIGCEDELSLNNMCRRYIFFHRYNEALVLLDEAMKCNPNNAETQRSVFLLNESIKQQMG